jgi:uncharacterized protein (DUF2141 family)
MSKIYSRSFIVLALAATLSISAWARPSHAAELSIDIKNVGDKGNVMVALYSTTDKWLGKSTRATHTAAAGNVQVQFKDLPEGDYAVALFIDEDKSGKMETNALGIPIETVAFSNDASGSFGPPKFEQAKFSVGRENKTIVINVK